MGSIFHRSYNSVKNIVDKCTKIGEIKDRPFASRPKILNMAEVRFVVRDVKKNVFKSAVKIAEEVSSILSSSQHNTPSITFKWITWPIPTTKKFLM